MRRRISTVGDQDIDKILKIDVERWWLSCPPLKEETFGTLLLEIFVVSVKARMTSSSIEARRIMWLGEQG